MNQKQAVNHIQNLLIQRSIKIEPGYFTVVEQPCIVLERNDRSIAVDPSSAIWVGELKGNWRCIDQSCTVSGALEAIEFLINEE